MSDENKYWGYHLTLDVKECAAGTYDNKEHLEKWIKALVKKIDMVAYGEPQIIHFGHGEKHLAGWTVLQLIETSNITAHYCDEYGDVFIDVFSCKEFNPQDVVDNIIEFFQPQDIQNPRFFKRGITR
jgi:S-adenosylmethionine/arginine decarboxylase-like enzyme